MGRIKHNVIVVTAFQKEAIDKGMDKATSLGLVVTNIVRGTANEYYSFLIAPDGSKEGWDESDKMDVLREEWIKFADKLQEHGLYLDFVHLSFGGDDDTTTILNKAIY